VARPDLAERAETGRRISSFAMAPCIRWTGRGAGPEVGKLADLVVLERNLFEVPAEELHAVRVMRTIVEGKTVFQRP
jgi:hypothetical protein